MATPLWWRRVRQHFGIAAPKMRVRTHLPWWGRAALVASLLAVIGGMWWWGFDFGQIFGGFNRKEVEARLTTLESEGARLHTEAAELRARNSALESELAMTRGAREALSKQATELSGENAQLKDELAFLQKLLADSSKIAGLQIQRLALEPDGEDTWRYALLVVRGGNPKDEFVGHVAVHATLASADGGSAPARTLVLPEDDPATASALALKFKYYQRVEGRIRVPAGHRVTAMAVRAYEAGHGSPRATRTLTLD
ncbi:MAG: hypothetical protein IT517_09445 [Burkholderiales bacterium]|nr:hypothetical protein [Burkholderiales bacterium]